MKTKTKTKTKTKKNIITENDYKDTELKKLNIVNKKNTEKNIFTIDELKTKTKTKKNIINVSNEDDYEDTELSDLDLSI